MTAGWLFNLPAQDNARVGAWFSASRGRRCRMVEHTHQHLMSRKSTKPRSGTPFRKLALLCFVVRKPADQAHVDSSVSRGWGVSGEIASSGTDTLPRSRRIPAKGERRCFISIFEIGFAWPQSSQLHMFRRRARCLRLYGRRVAELWSAARSKLRRPGVSIQILNGPRLRALSLPYAFPPERPAASR